MSLKSLETKWRKLLEEGKDETLEAIVLSSFFGHPRYVESPQSPAHRPLDLNRPEDMQMLLGSIHRKFEWQIKTLHFAAQEKARELYIDYSFELRKKDCPSLPLDHV